MNNFKQIIQTHFLIAFSVAAMLYAGLLLFLGMYFSIGLADELLYLFIIAPIFAAHQFDRRVYLPSLGIISLLSAVVIFFLVDNFFHSFRVLLYVIFFLLVVCEYLYRSSSAIRQSQAALQESEFRFRTVLEGLPASIFAHDMDGRFVLINAATCENTGYTRDELLQLSVSDIDPASLTRDDRTHLWHKLKTGQSQTIQSTHYRKDGSHYPAEIHLNAITLYNQPIILPIVFDISDRLERETTYAKILKTSIDGFWVINAEGRLVNANPAAANMLGYSVAEMKNLHLNDIDADETPEETKKRIEYVKTKGNAFFETRHKRKDGSIINVEMSASYLPFNGGLFYAFSRDITQRKRIETALENRIVALTRPLEDETRVDFEDLFNLNDIQRLQDQFAQAAGVASVITQVDGTPITQPSNFCRLCKEIIRHTEKGKANCFKSDAALGRFNPNGPTIQPCLSGGLWDAGAAISVGGKHIASWLIGQVRDETQTEEQIRAYAREIGADEDSMVSAFHEVPSMSREQFENVAQTLFTLANQLSTSAFQNVQQARFITERKKVEEALQLSEEKYRLLIENQNDLVVQLDLDQNIIFVSPSYCKMFGKTESEIFSSSFYPLIHEEDRMPVKESLNRVLQPPYTSWHEERALAVDGWRWFAWSVKAILSETGQVASILSVGRDITDRKQAEEALRESKKRVRAKLDSLLSPEGDMSHLELADVIDTEAIQSIMDEFYAVTHIGVGIIDMKGKILVATGWQDICTKFHRCHPDTARNCLESDTLLSTGVLPGEFKAYRCKNGMYDIATPLYVGERHMGNLFLGQFFYGDEQPYEEEFRARAKEHGFDEEAYLKALERVPRWSRDIVDHVMHFYARFANLISHLSYGNLKLAHILEQQRQAEEALREATARQMEAVKAGNVGFWDWDFKTNKVQYSAEWKKHIGYEIHEIGDDYEEWESRVHPNDLDRVLQQIDFCIRERKQDLKIEFRFRHKDGSYRWILAQASVVVDEHDEPIRMRGSHVDVTDIKQAEEAIRENRQMLAEAEAFAGLGAWSWDVLNDSWELSDNWLAIHGCAKAPSTTQELMEIAHSDDIDKIEKAFSIVLTGEAPYDIEHRIIRQDTGEIRHVQAYGEARKDENGQIIRVTGVGLDITDRKQAEQEKERLQNQLTQSQKMESVGRLAGGVAHDFNNMLSVILGHVGLAMEELNPSEPLYEDLKEIKKAGERSADLTRQLLAFARKQIISPKVVNLNDMVESMLKMLRRLIGEDIELIWSPGSDLWSIKVDPSQIDQMIANLCVNARDAITGVGQITIETKNKCIDEASCANHPYFTPGNFVMLSVSDNGCGMDKETLEHIFDPFYTTKQMGEGTGLGLATVYGIVKQNNGFINVYSEPGQGTRFNIYLHKHLPETDPQTEEKQPEQDTYGHETILLVEDEQSLLELSQKMLLKRGYRVLSATTPRDAIALAEKHAGEIHLLMTDIIMPEMNGRELADYLLTLHPNLKLLFMSGYTADVIAHQGILDENMHFIQKPFSIRELSKTLRQALEETTK